MRAEQLATDDGPVTWAAAEHAYAPPMAPRRRLPIFGERDVDMAIRVLSDDTTFGRHLCRDFRDEGYFAWLNGAASVPDEFGMTLDVEYEMMEVLDGEMDPWGTSLAQCELALRAPYDPAITDAARRCFAEYRETWLSEQLPRRFAGYVAVEHACAEARFRAMGFSPPETAGVYFVRSGTDGPIKIGKANNVRNRIAGLQTAHPWPLHLLLVLPGSEVEERALHTEFKAARMRGEWFEPHRSLLEFIDAKRRARGAT
jgi:hypothetical protein